MTSAEMAKLLWDLANAITGFAVVQGSYFRIRLREERSCGCLQSKGSQACDCSYGDANRRRSVRRCTVVSDQAVRS